MMNLGKLMADPEAMKRFGNTVVVWDLHTRKPKKILDVPGAPLEIRCAWGAQHNYCFTTTALTSKIWLIYEDGRRATGRPRRSPTSATPSKIPLPVDISISADDTRLWVDTWNDGKTRLFDISRPASSEADLRGEDRRADQHGVAELGREARLLHLVAARELGQDRGRPGDLQYFKATPGTARSSTPQVRDRLRRRRSSARRTRCASALARSTPPRRRAARTSRLPPRRARDPERRVARRRLARARRRLVGRCCCVARARGERRGARRPQARRACTSARLAAASRRPCPAPTSCRRSASRPTARCSTPTAARCASTTFSATSSSS